MALKKKPIKTEIYYNVISDTLQLFKSYSDGKIKCEYRCRLSGRRCVVQTEGPEEEVYVYVGEV
jgi:hypothetical protein